MNTDKRIPYRIEQALKKMRYFQDQNEYIELEFLLDDDDKIIGVIEKETFKVDPNT